MGSRPVNSRIYELDWLVAITPLRSWLHVRRPPDVLPRHAAITAAIYAATTTFRHRLTGLLFFVRNPWKPRACTFHRSVWPIHAYAALGLRFSSTRRDRARDPVQPFPYTSGTRLQRMDVFIRGFASRSPRAWAWSASGPEKCARARDPAPARGRPPRRRA